MTTPSWFDPRCYHIRITLLIMLACSAGARRSRSSSFTSRRWTIGFLDMGSTSVRRDVPSATRPIPLQALSSTPNPNNGQDDQGILPPKFNPFSYQTSSSSSSSSSLSSGSVNKNVERTYSTNYSTLISLRKTYMQELNQQLLNASAESQLQELLESNKEFLLEPLEEDDAVLEEDSIYSPTMTRAERYQAYRRTMEERVASSRNAQVKRVLVALKEFVLRHE